MSPPRAPLRVAFLHPELGLGGAERFVVDAAAELDRRGHRVVLYTARHDVDRAFPATRDGRLDVRVRAAIPGHFANRLRAPAAIVRVAWLARSLARDEPAVDVVVADLVPHVIPWVRRRTGAPVVYYGHSPDRLLTRERNGWYRLYRAPLDRLEGLALRRADTIAVNSRFTAEAFCHCFPALRDRALEILHPGVALAPPATTPQAIGATHWILLCIGRLAPEKNLELAIATLAALRGRVPDELYSAVRLVIAGGYDARLAESESTLRRLLASAREHGVAGQVEIRTSISDAERLDLLGRSSCVVHTHPAEHFGIVPLEAMAAGRPVVAVNHGGPLETIVDGETGFLRPPEAAAFAEAVARVLCDRVGAERMGRAGRERVARLFSLEVMGTRLEALLQRVVSSARSVAT